MKIAICIMSTNMEPSLRNMVGMKNTFIKRANELRKTGLLKNEYDFFIYYSDKNIEYASNSMCIIKNEGTYDNLFNIHINEEESVYRTFEKTIYVFKELESMNKYDWIVRINISTYVNIDLLDAVIGRLNHNNIYCNAINSYVDANSKYVNNLYPRGDFYIMSGSLLKPIIEQAEKYMYCDTFLKDRPNIEHVDDCLIGVCIINHFKKGYNNHLKMIYYNFISGMAVEPNNVYKYSIASRVKTVPPNVGYSGYSWDDNEYRKKDAEKMFYLYEMYNKNIESGKLKYNGTVESDLLVDKKNSRPTLFVEVSSKNMAFFNEYLKS